MASSQEDPKAENEQENKQDDQDGIACSKSSATRRRRTAAWPKSGSAESVRVHSIPSL